LTGPLTNVALALALDPAATAQLTVVAMGGALYGKGNSSFGAEFNFHADPKGSRLISDHCFFIQFNFEFLFLLFYSIF
jgi:inosine-uridine nucleoside N-ribohydrolase